jgi:hypothetical protein
MYKMYTLYHCIQRVHKASDTLLSSQFHMVMIPHSRTVCADMISSAQNKYAEKLLNPFLYLRKKKQASRLSQWYKCFIENVIISQLVKMSDSLETRNFLVFAKHTVPPGDQPV